jgi:hydrogenase maturation protease
VSGYERRAGVLVLGLGNELFTDEGVGVVAGRRLDQLDLPGVEVIDGGTLGIALLPEIEGREALLVLDAVAKVGAQPGQIIEFDEEDLYRPLKLMYSAHQVGIDETLAAARLMGKAPLRARAVGLVPFSLETGYGLSPRAEERLDELLERARAVLAEWGVDGA